MIARSTFAAVAVAFVAAGLLRHAAPLTAQAPHAPAMPPVPANLAALESHLADLRMLTDSGENAEAYFSPDGTHLIFQSSPDPVSCDQMYVMKVDGTIATLESVRHSDWGAVCQVTAAIGELAAGDLYLYPLVNPDIRFDLYLLHDSRRPLTLAARRFVEILQARLEQAHVSWQQALAEQQSSW